MEGLAERAGVSKALPYAHFDNSDDVLVALYVREIALIAQRITAALARADGRHARMKAIVHAYFDVVDERGAVLAVLTGPGSHVAEHVEDGSALRQFVIDIIVSTFAIEAKKASVLVETLQATLAGAIATWVGGFASRRDVEEMVVRYVTGGLEAIESA